MSEVKKIATRDSYGAALVELAKDHPDVVVLDADLAAATKTGVFKKAYPDRHFDCGIAESNMMAKMCIRDSPYPLCTSCQVRHNGKGEPTPDHRTSPQMCFPACCQFRPAKDVYKRQAL